MSPRPVESSHSLILPRPIRVVRGFVADFGHAALWDPATLRSDPVGAGPARVGSAWTTRSVLAGQPSTGHYRLEWSTPHGIVLAGRHPGLTRTVEFALVDLGDHTEVHLTMRYSPRGLAARVRRRLPNDALAELTLCATAALPAALDSHVSDLDDVDDVGADTAADDVPPGQSGLPSQVIDLWYLSWRLASVEDDGSGGGVYSASSPGPRDPRTFQDLTAVRGPLRPVVGPSAADVHQIDQLLAQAGNRAAPTIAAAVNTAYTQLLDAHAHLDTDTRRGLARQRLTAASEGTPPAAGLLALLSEHARASTTAVHPATRDALATMIIRWIGHPDHYTDPAVALITMVPPPLMPRPMRRARRAWVRTLSPADGHLACECPDPKGQHRP